MRIYLSPPNLIPDEISYVHQVLQKGWIAPNGPENKQLEKLIGSYANQSEESALTCSSGTAALHLIYASIGLEKGDIVFCPTLTFVATVNPLIQLGLIPWFVDSEEENGGMSPELLEEAIKTSLKQNGTPRAVIVVHLMGFPAKIQRIKEICDAYQLILIEDAAGAIGTEVNYSPVLGQYATISALSFNGNKIITTSGGGAILTKDYSVIERARLLRDQARIPGFSYRFNELGYNYGLSNISAAIGVAQWQRLQDKLETKHTLHQRYKALFNPDSVKIWESTSEWESPNYWLTVIFLSIKDRQRVIELFKQNEIECRAMWPVLNELPYLKDYPKTLNGTAKRWAETGLCLPSGEQLTEENQREIAELVNTIANTVNG